MINPKRTVPHRSIDDNVSDVVKKAYGVIADNIRTSREAADRFRQGDYKLDEVPDDLNTMIARGSNLARDLNLMAFKVYGTLVSELIKAAAEGSQAGGGATPSSAADGAIVSPKVDSSKPLTLTADFKGASVSEGGALTATLETNALRRAKQSRRPQEIEAGPFTSKGKAVPETFGEVKFEFDLKTGGLVAEIEVTNAAKAGWYSSVIYFDEEVEPLGVLHVRLETREPQATVVTPIAGSPPAAPEPNS